MNYKKLLSVISIMIFLLIILVFEKIFIIYSNIYPSFLVLGNIPPFLFGTSLWFTPFVINYFLTFSEEKKPEKSKLNDKTIEKFANYMKRYPKYYNYTAEIVKKSIPKKVTKPVIIDLGAGPGYLSKAIAKIIPKSQILAIDPSKKMLEYAKKELKFDNCKIMPGDSENIPVEDKFADLIVSRLNLTYWKNPKDSFIEINRVLKPGGILVLESLNKKFSKLKLFVISIRLFFNSAGVEVIRYHSDAYKSAYDSSQVEHFLKNSSFKVIYKEGVEKDWKFILVSEKKQ